MKSVTRGAEGLEAASSGGRVAVEVLVRSVVLHVLQIGRDEELLTLQAQTSRRRPMVASGAVLLVGLTGGIGSGKSSVSAAPAERTARW